MEKDLKEEVKKLQELIKKQHKEKQRSNKKLITSISLMIFGVFLIIDIRACNKKLLKKRMAEQELKEMKNFLNFNKK